VRLDVGELIVKIAEELHQLIFKLSLIQDGRKRAGTFGFATAYGVRSETF